MAADVLTLEQMEKQRAQRAARLDMLVKRGAPEGMIEAARKHLLLMERRIERARSADYEESIRGVRRMG